VIGCAGHNSAMRVLKDLRENKINITPSANAKL